MKKKLAIFGSLKFGAGDYIAHLYPHLKNLFDVEVLSFSHMKYDDPVGPKDSELVFKNIPNPRLIVRPKDFLTLSESYKKIFDFLEKYKPQVFNLHVAALVRILHYFFYPLVSYLKTKGVEIIYTVHDVLHIGEGNLISNDILHPFYDLADVAFVGNEMERERLQKIFAFKNEIIIGKHGVYDLFDQNQVNSDEARKQLSIDSKAFVVLFFGILRENKGLDELMKAISLLIKNGSSRNIVLFVSTTLRDHFELKKYYESLVEKLGLKKIVKLDIRIKDTMTLMEIERVFKGSNVVVLPYTHISQSGILNLAVGFKKPVVITDAFIEAKDINNKLGLVVPMKDEQKLAEAILQMQSNYNKYVNLFVKNLEFYNKEHGWENLAQQMFKISEK